MVGKCVKSKDSYKIYKSNIVYIKSLQKYKKYCTMLKSSQPSSAGVMDATPSTNSNQQASVNQNRQRPLGKQQLASLLQDVLTPAEDYVRPNNDNGAKKRPVRPVNKRAHSVSPAAARPRSPPKKPADRRCQSLSPCTLNKKKSQEQIPPVCASATDGLGQSYPIMDTEEKDLVMPQCVITKVMRILSTKKREFLKLRKCLVTQQNALLESYAQLKELELRVGVPHTDDSLGEVRIVSVSNWPAHDLLLLVRDDLEVPLHSEISGIFGPHVLQQITAQLNPIPEEMLAVSAEIMARRIELLNVLRGKHRNDRATYLTNLEWKTKNSEFDNETEKLHRLVAGTAENLKAKINYSLELAKIPWVDREIMTKKIERLHKENMILQHKIDEYAKKDPDDTKELGQMDNIPSHQALCEELSKERAAREALKEVVSAAESMLRVARARIATLERQLKDTRAELDAARKKHKDLEQLVNRLAHHTNTTYRHRETSYDARSKKLLEVSKTGEITIETLSRQRDALELRVKELREQAEQAEKSAAAKEAEQRARAESLQAKEKVKAATENRVIELDAKVKELEEQLQALRERSVRLVDMERRRCLEYVPLKENEPSDRETEIWKELQVTRVALSRVEEELRQSRADKDNFLNSLSRIAQGEGAESVQEKIATELLDREQKIAKLQHVIEDQRENEKLMEQSMTQYENQLAALRLEVKRLRNYDGYAKEVPYQELHTELMELHMQVETLSRERTALVTAAASRALMLERHERAADLFARMIRARRDLSALLDGRTDPPTLDETAHAEVSRSLSSVCASAADTWTALRAERARVLRLESAVLAQSLQLEREGRVRTQLERRRAILEREIMRSTIDGSADPSVLNPIKNPSLVFSQSFFTYFGLTVFMLNLLAFIV
ncbi:myosin heavy chain, fast skeletal muscle-like isoform X2 [Spodoptera litura]|uniref:Myosin heavy chain, fast skeletal muscle-like isoform X2 n=1 Tax=Spodoptera litura TaxID=69820 RepID=A0A9J7IYA6_SPOLT|nr:myosin heavy chain, fast skeletal muscle-like isoform X2 [Spodoptera litura]